MITRNFRVLLPNCGRAPRIFSSILHAPACGLVSTLVAFNCSNTRAGEELISVTSLAEFNGKMTEEIDNYQGGTDRFVSPIAPRKRASFAGWPEGTGRPSVTLEEDEQAFRVVRI